MKLQRQKKLYVTKELRDLMLAVMAGRTCPGYGKTHYCTKHKAMVDAGHLSRCDLVKGMGKVNKYNEVLERVRLQNINREKQISILIHYGWL